MKHSPSLMSRRGLASLLSRVSSETIVGESVKSGHRIKKWSNFAMAKPISKVVKCGQILLTGQIFRAPAARTARNTRLLFCIVHSVLDRFCDDQRPEPQLQSSRCAGAAATAY